MSRYRNKFIRREQKNFQLKNNSNLKIGKKYRKELEPFLGASISIECSDFSCKRGEINGESCIQLLLKNPEIVKVPSYLSNLDLPSSSHLWVTLDENWKCNKNNTEKLCLRGFLYEYAHCGYKNIGFQALAIKDIQRKLS